MDDKTILKEEQKLFRLIIDNRRTFNNLPLKAFGISYSVSHTVQQDYLLSKGPAKTRLPIF